MKILFTDMQNFLTIHSFRTHGPVSSGLKQLKWRMEHRGKVNSICFMKAKSTDNFLNIFLNYFLAHVWCKTNNSILLFYAFVQDANDSFVPCFDFVPCIMTSAVPFFMDHKPFSGNSDESWYRCDIQHNWTAI